MKETEKKRTKKYPTGRAAPPGRPLRNGTEHLRIPTHNRFDHKRVINHLKEARWIASIVVVITEIDQTNGKASVRKFVPVEWQG